MPKPKNRPDNQPDDSNEPQRDELQKVDSADGAEPVAIQTVDRLRAAASPVRMRLFKTLSWKGPSRTSDLAEELGLPHNSVSYHLRGLERAGYIKRTEGQDKRESWWSLASPAGISFRLSEDLKAPGLDLLQLDHQATAELLAHSEEINPDNQWPTIAAGFGAHLTHAELQTFYARLEELVTQIHNRANRHADRDEATYYLTINFFPVKLPD